MGEVKCLELAGASLLFATAGAVLDELQVQEQFIFSYINMDIPNQSKSKFCLLSVLFKLYC